MRLSENEFQPYMEISKWGRWRRNENGAMFSVSVNNSYTVLCEDNSLPDIYADYRQNAKVVEEFDLDNSDDVLCFVGVQRDSAWPFLVIAQRYSPGFDPEALLVEETDVLFIGAGERLLAYDIRRRERLWEDKVILGFFGWSRYDSTLVMSAELELAGWNLEGRKLWSVGVEPPWEYAVENGMVKLDVMGEKTSFDIARGPSS